MASTDSSNATNYNTFMEGILPGYGKLTSTGTGVIQDMLSGLPSPSAARQSNAYFGAGSGMGAGSDFLRNRGYDLYGQQAKQQEQQGVTDMLAFTQGIAAPANTYTGTQNQMQLGQGNLGLGYAKLGQEAGEFGQNLALQKQQQANQFNLGMMNYNLGEQQLSQNQLASYLQYLS